MAAKPLTGLSFDDRGRQISLDQYLEWNQVAGLLILKDGKIQLEKYRYGNTSQTRWMSMSIAKSITSTLIGAAIKQGKIRSLNDPVIQYVPSVDDGIGCTLERNLFRSAIRSPSFIGGTDFASTRCGYASHGEFAATGRPRYSIYLQYWRDAGGSAITS
jgi:hypothetical protein